MAGFYTGIHRDVHRTHRRGPNIVKVRLLKTFQLLQPEPRPREAHIIALNSISARNEIHTPEWYHYAPSEPSSPHNHSLPPYALISIIVSTTKITLMAQASPSFQHPTPSAQPRADRSWAAPAAHSIPRDCAPGTQATEMRAGCSRRAAAAGTSARRAGHTPAPARSGTDAATCVDRGMTATYAACPGRRRFDCCPPCPPHPSLRAAVGTTRTRARRWR